MEIKKVEYGYADVDEKYFIYEIEDEKWGVYKKTERGTLNFIWSFKTLDEAIKFVESKG